MKYCSYIIKIDYVIQLIIRINIKAKSIPASYCSVKAFISNQSITLSFLTRTINSVIKVKIYIIKGCIVYYFIWYKRTSENIKNWYVPKIHIWNIINWISLQRLVFKVYNYLILNTIIPHIHTVRDIKSYQNRGLIKLSYLIATGLILHDFPEGFAIANSYAYSSSLGLLVAASLFFHNLPEGYVLSACASRHAPKNHFYQLAFLSVISTFLGTFTGILLLGAYSALNTVLTAAAAGTMIYISLHELSPMSFKLKHLWQFFIGIITAIIIFICLAYFINF